MLQAVLFDWGETLVQFEWDDELLAAGHAAGLEALGRGEEADEFTERFAAERLPALLADGAAEQLDYGDGAARRCSGTSTDDELDRFLDAEHAAWRPARALVNSAHALLETLRGRKPAPRGRRQHVARARRGSSAASSRSSVWPSASTASSSRARSACASRRREIFERALAELGVDAARGALRRRPARRRHRRARPRSA